MEESGMHFYVEQGYYTHTTDLYGQPTISGSPIALELVSTGNGVKALGGDRAYTNQRNECGQKSDRSEKNMASLYSRKKLLALRELGKDGSPA